MKTRALAALAAALILAALAPPAYALDSTRAYSAPGNALVAPFDARDGKVSFVLVSSVAKEKLSTHWAFWSDSCAHLADVSICLTPEDTVVVDPTAVSAIGADNTPVGPTVTAAAGHAGFVTITAYATNEACEDALRTGERLVDDAITGTVTIADVATTASFGASPLVLGLDVFGQYTDLPDVLVQEVDVGTFAPGDLASATVYAFALEEHAGDFAGEVGAITGQVRASAAYFDNMEVRTSLPDLAFGCAVTLDLLSFLDPLEGATAGLLRLADIQVLRNGGTSSEPLGGTTGAYGIVGEALGPFGAVFEPTFKTTSIFD